MRYAIISDIHSNLEALTAFAEEVDGLGVDATVCLGDIVGYNANPNECLDMVREAGMLCVMGNHDARVVGLGSPSDFNPMAREAVLWTRERLTEENAEFLKGLPRSRYVDEDFLAFHGWVNDTDSYIFTAMDALMNFRLLDGEYPETSLAFFGHTHVAITYVRSGEEVNIVMDQEVPVDAGEDGSVYLVNPGGLGQPRDHNPSAPFAINDTDTATVTFHRVEYDVEETARKVLEAGLSTGLAERLRVGW